jgi:hypothetical protein
MASADRAECPGHGRDERHDRGSADNAQRHAEQEHRKAEEGVVDADDHVAHHRAGRNPDDRADQAYRQRPFEIVPGDRRVVVAKGLQRRNLRALQCERAGQRHVEDEGRDRHEDERQQEAERLQLRQLVLHRPVGHLQRPRDGAEPAVWFEDAVDPRDHLID